MTKGYPEKQGLYEPANEHDSCGFGFVVDIEGRKSHSIVQQALQVLLNLEHRGAAGAEKNTGDGAGILLQTPDAFLRKEARKLGIELPPTGRYAAGMVFLPSDPQSLAACQKKLEEVVRSEGQVLMGWRDVPYDLSTLGDMARASQPVIRQIWIGAGEGAGDLTAFERKLYVIRRLSRKSILRSNNPGRREFYVASLSARTIV